MGPDYSLKGGCQAMFTTPFDNTYQYFQVSRRQSPSFNEFLAIAALHKKFGPMMSTFGSTDRTLRAGVGIGVKGSLEYLLGLISYGQHAGGSDLISLSYHLGARCLRRKTDKPGSPQFYSDSCCSKSYLRIAKHHLGGSVTMRCRTLCPFVFEFNTHILTNDGRS